MVLYCWSLELFLMAMVVCLCWGSQSVLGLEDLFCDLEDCWGMEIVSVKTTDMWLA